MGRALRCLAGASVLALLCACGAATTPTEPSRVASSGFGTISATVAPTTIAADFSACLAGAPRSSCFSASGAQSGAPSGALPIVAPGRPLNLASSTSGASVTLTWSAPTNGDLPTAYSIEAGSAAGLADLANVSTGTALTVFQASGVGRGTYYVRVRASNAAGASAPSNEIVLVVGGGSGVAPGAPTGLILTANAGGTVALSWRAANGAPTSYVIEAGSQSGRADLANSDLGSAATSMTATGVGAGTYYVRVRAKNAFGVSEPSNEVVIVVSTLACNPNIGQTQMNIYAAYTATVAVGRSAGKTATFLFQHASYSETAFVGTYTDADGATGSVGPAYLYPPNLSPGRVNFGFVPSGTAVDVDGVVFAGGPTLCSGNVVLELVGEVHMGYNGSRDCQPGETCDGGWHFRGPGYPMTLTRR
jgi:hypothetical protein